MKTPPRTQAFLQPVIDGCALSLVVTSLFLACVALGM